MIHIKHLREMLVIISLTCCCVLAQQPADELVTQLQDWKGLTGAGSSQSSSLSLLAANRKTIESFFGKP